MLFTLFLALFSPFVVPPLFAVSTSVVLVLTAYLGAPFSAPLCSFSLPARASGLSPLLTTSFPFFPSTVSFLTSIPVPIFTLSPQPLCLSVSTSTPALIPIVPSIAVSGSRWPVISKRVVHRAFSTPAAPSAVRPLRSWWASTAAALPTVPVVALWMPPIPLAASHTAVWGHVQVPVGFPEFFPGISKHMQEIAVLPFRALLSVKQTWGEERTQVQW